MRTLLLRLILFVIILTTLVAGVIGYLSSEQALRAGIWIYGAQTIELTPLGDYLIRMLASGLIALGLLNILAFLNPRRYRHIILVDAIMLVLRALQRVLSANVIVDAFGVSAFRLYTNAGVMLVLSVALIWLSWGNPSRRRS